MNKMLVDGGASVNLMPYTTFRKLGKGAGDLIETDMMLKDFGVMHPRPGGNKRRIDNRNQDFAHHILRD